MSTTSRVDATIAAIDDVIGVEPFTWMPVLRDHDDAPIPGELTYDGEALSPWVGLPRIVPGFRPPQIDAFIQGLERMRASLLALSPTIQHAIRRLAALLPPPVTKYTAAQAHYGVRRVTARQYRAWKRQEGRR